MKTNNFIIKIVLLLLIGVFILKNCGPRQQEIIETAEMVLLSGFEDKKTWGISPERGFSISLSGKHVTQGKHSLKVKFPKWDLPRINTKRLKHAWGDYENFSFDVYNPHKEELDFKIRLDDEEKNRIV